MTPDEKAVDGALLRAANKKCGTNYKSWDDVQGLPKQIFHGDIEWKPWPKGVTEIKGPSYVIRRAPHHRDLSFIKPAGDFPYPWHWRLYFGLRAWVRARRVWRRVTGI